MMKSGMLDIRGDFKSKYEGNIHCKTFDEVENTQHQFKCEKYKKCWSELRGKNIHKFIKLNKRKDLAQIVRNIYPPGKKKHRNGVSNYSHRSPYRVEPIRWWKVILDYIRDAMIINLWKHFSVYLNLPLQSILLCPSHGESRSGYSVH